jgi:hypothetical protein
MMLRHRAGFGRGPGSRREAAYLEWLVVLAGAAGGMAGPLASGSPSPAGGMSITRMEESC